MFAIISCLPSIAILPQNGFRRGCAAAASAEYVSTLQRYDDFPEYPRISEIFIRPTPITLMMPCILSSIGPKSNISFPIIPVFLLIGAKLHNFYEK